MVSLLVTPPKDLFTVPAPAGPLKAKPKLQRQNAVIEPPKKKLKADEPLKKVVAPYFFKNGVPVYKIA